MQQDLHHVHLAECQTLHFRHCFLHLQLVLRSLQVLQLGHDCVCGIGRLPSCKNFAHIFGIKRKHAILREGITLIHLAVGDL